MTFQETLDYLYTTLPMFQRIGPPALKQDMTNTVRLCEALGNPHLSFRSIHVAGTNGKGSVSHMLASVLQEANYKTGLYTSPHLKSFTERIRVNGVEVEEEFIVRFVERIRALAEELRPSFFEVTVAMAFEWFAEQKVDVAVIETGLGGRLDSTNIITPIVSVITNVGMDHKELLGDTPSKIAAEKGGIIKQAVPVVVGEYQEAVIEVFRKIAGEMQAPLYVASVDYEARFNEAETLIIKKRGQTVMEGVDVPLKGWYQARNVATVLKTVELISDILLVENYAIRSGLERTVANTGLKGRWQILQYNPLIICDTAHNPEGLIEVMKQVRAQVYDTLYVVFGVVKDKDVAAALRLIPEGARCIFCEPKLPRALPAGELHHLAAELGIQGEVVPDVNEALAQAKRLAGPHDMIYVGGSTFVVAEINGL